MSEFIKITFEGYSCLCPVRSRSFPATVVVVVDGGDFQAHWRDGVGFAPCDTSEQEYVTLYSVLQELNLEAPPFEAWQALVMRATADVNQLPIEHWRQLWLAVVENQLRRAERELEHALSRVDRERNALQLAQCRFAAAHIVDLDLSAAAHRLIEENFAGSPAELLATAQAVLRRG